MNHRQRVNISCLLIISALFKKHDVALADCDLLRHYFINEQVLNIVPLLRWFMHSHDFIHATLCFSHVNYGTHEVIDMSRNLLLLSS